MPKAIVWTVLLPVRGLIWVYDRYDVSDRYYATFYNPSRTFGITPTIAYATGFSIMVGARLISKDTFGQSEHLRLEGAWGGRYQALGAAWLDSGTRFNPVKLTIGGNFDRFARLKFFGIGNADSSPPPAMLINPLVNPTAVKTYYRYQELRAALTADWRLFDGVNLIGLGAFTDLNTHASTRDPAIDTVYNPADLIGFDDAFQKFYGQLELRIDRRRVARPRWENTMYTTGWLVSGFAGGVQGVKGSDNFAHYGVDLQAFIHFALGPRMLWLRFWGEGVTGDVNEVPFYELPYIGGDILRGYDWGRFRDRVSGVATAQYMWDIQRNTDAFLFVDAGRVFHSIWDVTLDQLRVGFGGGLSLHTQNGFLVALSLAGSIDGGVFLTATLNPLWNEVPRWR
ncbi:MAG: hypothetical protein HOV81_20275 [Kofleriaceae bacterium]|nr:hypothetical protein [Kofleriaceae bacterium]